MNAPTTTTAPAAPDPPAPDPAELEAFVDGVLDDVKGHHVALMAALGDHLGLFDALAGSPATSTQLAHRTELDERHVREWLAGMTAAEYVTYDPSTTTFRLSPEQAMVLADDDSPVGLGGLFHGTVGMWDVLDDVKTSFRTGGGIELDRYTAPWWDGMERFTDVGFEHHLLETWIPQAEGVEEVLAGGARIADVGCGRGRALVKILQAFPDVTAVGYDLSSAQLEGARRNAAAAGVDDRVRFVRHDAAKGLDGPFDLVTSFDVAHDLVDPDAMFRAIHDALTPGGSYLLLEFRVADRLEDNINRNAAMFYAWSLTYCLPTSRAHDGEGLGTCGLPESEVRARCLRAGFSAVEVVPYEDPFDVLYQARA